MRERVEISERLRLCFGGVEGRKALPSTSHWRTTNPLDRCGWGARLDLTEETGAIDWKRRAEKVSSHEGIFL